MIQRNIIPPAEAISGTATGLIGGIAGTGRGWLERIKGASPAEAEQRERETAQSITTPIQTEQGRKIAGALQAPLQQALTPLVDQMSSDIHKWSGGKIAVEDVRRGINTAIILLPAVKGMVKTVPRTIRGFRALSKKAGATSEQLAALEKLPGDLAVDKIIKMESKASPASSRIPAPKDQPVLSSQEILEQVVEPLKKLKPFGRQQKRMYGKEFGQRIAKGEAVAREIGGEAGFFAKKAQLKGEYEKVALSKDFQSLRDVLSEETVNRLNNTIEYNPFLWRGEKVQAGEGLQAMLEGRLPQPKQLELLQTGLGEAGSELVSVLMKKRPLLQRAITLGLEIGNAPRSFMAGFLDLSFGGRQGIFAAPRFHREFARAWKKQFKEFGSEKAYQAAMDTVKNDPYYLLAREGQVAFTEMGKRMGIREEPYMSPLPEKIPILGHGIHMTGRSYTGFANKYRMDIFKRLAKDAENMGHKLEGNTQLLETIGDTVNALTGRGGLGKLGAIAPALNATFFSPRLWSSRLGIAFGKYQPLSPAFYTSLPKTMRMRVLKTWLAYAGAGISIVTAVKGLGGDVESDIRSPDFLKIRYGNTSIDIWGGTQQPIRTMAQFVLGQTKSSTTGKIRKVGGSGYKPLTRGEILGRHIEYKEAPLASFVHNWMQDTSGISERFSLKREASEKLVPIVAQDIWDLYIDDPDSLPIGLFAIFGVGVQTYERRKRLIK